MFQIKQNITIVILGIAAFIIMAMFLYIKGLSSELDKSKLNVENLKKATAEQQKVIEQKENDLSFIIATNSELNRQISEQKKELNQLNERFNVSANGERRDLGAITRVKPGLIQNIVNSATLDVNHCFELITDSNNKNGENNECKELF